MHKNFFSRLTKTLKFSNLSPNARSKLSWGLGAGFVFASSAFAINKMNLMPQNQNKNEEKEPLPVTEVLPPNEVPSTNEASPAAQTETKTEAQTENKSSENEALPADFQSPELEKFSDQMLKQAVENKYDVVIVWNSEDNVNTSLDEIKVLLYYLKEAHQKKGRKLKFFVVKPQNSEEVKAFEKEYNVSIRNDTIFLIRNRYSANLQPVSVQTALYNFEYIFSYFQKIRSLNPTNFDKFSHFIKNLPSNSLLIVSYLPKSSANYRNLRNEFADLVMERSLGRTRFKNLEFVSVSDPEIAKKLNIDTSNEGGLYILSKSSKYNHHRKSLTLNDTNLDLMPLKGNLSTARDALLAEMSLICKNYFIFEFPNFYQFSSKFSVVLKVDKNKIEKRDYNQCVDAFSKLHHKLRSEEKDLFKQLRMIKVNDKSSGDAYKVLIIDVEGREKEADAFDSTEPLTPERKAELVNQKPRSYTYRYPPEMPLNEDALLEFIKDVREGKIPEYFESQKEPNSQKYSKKIVKDNFKEEILDVDKDHVLFFQSHHCHACKQYGPHYEKFALDNLKNPQSNIQYNRMDSDHNQLENFVYFYHTPIFMVLKKEDKLKPFVYSSPFFTPDLLKNFINVTVSQQLISRDVEKKIFEKHEANKKLLEGYKLEQIQ